MTVPTARREEPAAPPVVGRWERRARAAYRRAEAVSRTARRWQARAPRVVRMLRTVYYPLAIALVAYMGYRASRRLDFSDVHYWALAVAYGAALVWWVALATGWSTLTVRRVAVEPTSDWCRTQVVRYLPGGIWAPVARATTVKGRVRDKAAAVLAENVIVLSIALAVGALWATVHDARWFPLVVVAVLPLLGAPWLERRASVTRRGVVMTSGIYGAGYLAYGVSAIFTQVAISGVHVPVYPLYIAGAACVAWAVGLVVVFAPGGVGVREVVYVWMLHGLYPSSALTAGAVAARLVTVLAELTVLVAVTGNEFLRRRAARVAA